MKLAGSRWFATAARSLILMGLGVLGLLLLVHPMYQTANQPRPPLSASADILGITLDDSARTSPSVWVTLEAEPPIDGSTSRVRFTFNFPAASDDSTVSGEIFFQGKLHRAFTACDLGQTTSGEFNQFGIQEKDLAYRLLRGASGGETSSQNDLDLAEKATSMDFTRFTFAEAFTGSDTQNGRYLSIECVLNSTSIWTHTSGPFWDVETPSVGLAVATETSSSGSDGGRVSLTSTLDVIRGDQLFYQEGYPAPSSRDQTTDSFSKTPSGTTYTGGQMSSVTGAANARYSDSVAESQGSTDVFFAGILAGLFASLIAAGLLGLVDEILRFRVFAEIAPEQMRRIQEGMTTGSETASSRGWRDRFKRRRKRSGHEAV